MTTRLRGKLSGYGYLPPGGEEGDGLIKSSDIDGDCAWGAISAGVEYVRVRSFGAVADGSEASGTADTAAINQALQVATDAGGGKIVFEGGNYAVNAPIIPDGRNLELIGDGAILTGYTPTIMPSFSGDDESITANNLLLGGVGIRENLPNSLEDVVIHGFRFKAGTATRGIHMTRFTRGCEIHHCSFENFTEYGILINGSWSFSLSNNRVSGVGGVESGGSGVGLGLGINGEGKGSGATACNVPNVQGNWFGRHATGCAYNFGTGGFFGGNTFEFNSTDGFRSQSANGITYMGNYHEGNDNDNVQFGGTNGKDFCVGLIMRGNHFSATTGSNIRLNSVQRGVFGPNFFSGTRTQHYVIGTTFNTENEIWVPAANTTYFSGLTNLNQAQNRLVTTNSLTKPTVTGSRAGGTALTSLLTRLDTLNIIVDGTSA